MQRAWIKAQKKKLCFKLSKVAYMGHVLGTDDPQADPEEITAIGEMPRLTDVQGVMPYWSLHLSLHVSATAQHCL